LKESSIVGGVQTLITAEALLPGAVSFDTTLATVAVFVPGVHPVTETENLQRDPTAIVAPLSDMPEGLVVVRMPVQTVAVLLMTRKPSGRPSVNPTPVSAMELSIGFSMTNPSETLEPTLTVEERKVMLRSGG